ncbi:MAG: hypothetical protein R6U46_03205 [Marinilabilia sp.]
MTVVTTDRMNVMLTLGIPEGCIHSGDINATIGKGRMAVFSYREHRDNNTALPALAKTSFKK